MATFNPGTSTDRDAPHKCGCVEEGNRLVMRSQLGLDGSRIESTAENCLALSCEILHVER